MMHRRTRFGWGCVVDVEMRLPQVLFSLFLAAAKVPRYPVFWPMNDMILTLAHSLFLLMLPSSLLGDIRRLQSNVEKCSDQLLEIGLGQNAILIRP